MAERVPATCAITQDAQLDASMLDIVQAVSDFKAITMVQMLDLGVLDFEEDFEELSAAAMKENTLKKTMKQMKEDWAGGPDESRAELMTGE